MKAVRKGEGGRSQKLEENMMHGGKLETGGKGQRVRRVNIVEEDRMMGGCRRKETEERGTSVALSILKREMSMSWSTEKDGET